LAVVYEAEQSIFDCNSVKSRSILMIFILL